MVKCSMFAARDFPLLRDLRELCVKKTRNSCLVSCNRDENTSAFPANPHRMIFLAHPHHLTPVESYSSKNRGRGGRIFQSCEVGLGPHTKHTQPQSAHGFTSYFPVYPGGGG